MYLIWNRLKYVLSPQFDVYETVATVVRNEVADIGFGTGFGTHLLARNAREVHGFEVDEDAIQFAKKVFPFKKLCFKFGDITKGIGGVYDYIIMIDVIEHIQNDGEAIGNVAEMMVDGGTFICSTPNRLSRYRKAETHYREYSPDDFSGVLDGVFKTVQLCNHRLEPLISKYENPILAVCR